MEEPNITSFPCKRCGKVFPEKWKLVRHLERKYVCKPALQNVAVMTLLDELKEIRNNASAHFCTYCNKGFKSKQGMFIHIGKCPKRESDIEEMKHKIATLSAREPQQPNITINITQNIQQTNNIIVLPFEQENVDHILSNVALLKDCCRNPMGGVPKLVKQTYFDPAHKENHNLACDEKFNIYILRDGEWCLQPQKATIDGIMDKQIAIIKGFFNTKLINSQDYSHVVYNGIHLFLKKYDTKHVETIKQLRKGTSDIIYEGTLRYNEQFLLTIPQYVG
jgi:hypothetical protein